MNEKLPLVVSNLKSNFVSYQLSDWLKKISPAVKEFTGTLIVCPSQSFLSGFSEEVEKANLSIKIGAQNISPFKEGAYTGEVAASQITDFAGFAIVGHSERRTHFKEDEKMLEDKVKMAIEAQITPIFCIQDENTPIPQGVEIVAYEPMAAIGSGNPNDPKQTKDLAAAIKKKGAYTILYGGSVTAENINSYVEKGLVDGVLVGTDSLEFQKLIDILNSIK